MKTPMQELIEQMLEIAKYGDSYEVAPCIEAAEAMLEKEQQVMCEFAIDYTMQTKTAYDFHRAKFNNEL